uniref:Gamma-interferon-inducible lysosomal thiol reductase n=1 Tax=Anser brachyrhynchus TaxID=132585 RepID=A0A8B9BBB9_9AVES
MHTQMAAASPRCSPLYPKNLLHAGGEPLRQPLAAQGSSRGAEPLLRELVPGMPRLPGRAALHHLAAAAQRDHEHHAGAVRQRAGRSRRGPVPCPCRWCCRPRSDRFVPQEKKVGGKWQFQCQHGSEECLGNMIQACLMHEAENFTTYFPVIFCMESGTSATKNLEACLQVYAPQLDAGRIAACVQGDLGTALMHRNAQLTEALDPPHEYVPWIVINGKHTDELEEQAQRSLLRLVCQLYQGEKPEGCQSAAAPKPRAVCKH